MADIRNGLPVTRALPPVLENAASGRSSSNTERAITMTLKILPNAVGDLVALGWLPAASRGDPEIITDAVVELAERALALRLRSC
jgi:hypothetical protein